MNIPAPCNQCKDTDWVIVERNGKAGAQRCQCRRGRALAHLDAHRGERIDGAPGAPHSAVMAAVERLSIIMRMVPSGEAAHMLIAEELRKFICDAKTLAWLVEVAPVVFKGEWPGVAELRALYCRVYRPKDGIEVESGMFELNDYPAIPGAPVPKQIEVGPARGGLISACADDVQLVESLAIAKAMPPGPAKLQPPEYLIPGDQR